ncbi:hypothetical protein ACIQVT_23220 [Streptomyces sp. NPDC100445]|uniref:hypothetical protein n=1 Tax=Streptomyces sp. NPDC100445 TaxID=3366102 RepID=UPI00382BFD8A
MSELEILQIAAPAAQALLTSMVTDAWQAARGRFARLLGRGNETEIRAIEDDLEDARNQVIEGSPERSLVAGEVWKARFRQALIANPEMAKELRELLSELNRAEPRHGDTAQQRAVARDNSVVFQQGSGTQNYYGTPNSNE